MIESLLYLYMCFFVECVCEIDGFQFSMFWFLLKLCLFNQDKRLSVANCSALKKQKAAFDETVQLFNATKHTLRSFLRDRKEQELNLGKIGEQRDLLMTKLARVQDERQARSLTL